MRREKACHRQTYKPKETPKVTREVLRRRRPAEGRPTNQKIYKKRLEFLRREEACQMQAHKQKETPKETREFLRREETCRRQAYKPKETNQIETKTD